MKPPGNPPGTVGIWTAPRLRAKLAAQKGLAPAPNCYVIWRATARTGAPEVRGYELPDESGRRDEAAFERWLLARGMAGAERLSVSVLVIREQLDEAGLVRECVLERRRGGVDGPYYGKVARVEFTGAAKLVRRYRASPAGRLVELPPEDDTGMAATSADPLSVLDSESFAGEDAAVHTYLGPGAIILDRRPPSLFEDMLGLSGIIHARRLDGAEVGCGVGWHGGAAFVLAADFPRSERPLEPPPELDAAVERALMTRDLVRHEIRLDDHGFYVIARERGRQTLVAIRLEGRATRIDPYTPGRHDAANDDQRRWLTYAETYEARTVLDSWRNGENDELAVLTIDPAWEAWRHVIDADGIEISRQSDNEAAAAVLYRERLNPPDEGPLQAHIAGPADTIPWIDATAPDYEASADSLLTAALAWSRVTTSLGAALTASGGEAGCQAVPHAVLDQLAALAEPLTALHASFSVGSLRRLIAQVESGTMTADRVAGALDELVTRIRDELALTRIVNLPSVPFRPDGEPPFGPLVEIHFPAAAFDIEEAVQCLALRRATAAVLHAAKVMHCGLLAVEALPSASDLTSLSWARLIETVRSGSADRDLAEALIRVRRAWRAPGMTPAAKYTEEESASVLEAVEAFMRLVAARMDEGENERGG